MIIGLTGPFASGKTEVVNHLIKKNFNHFSLSDSVREEARKRNIELTRENLQKLGNFLRETYGNNILAVKVIEKLDLNKNTIIDGIRNPSEAKELMKLNNFYFVCIDAPFKTRLNRVKSRNRESDENDLKSIKRFIELEKIDLGKNQK